MTSIKNNPPSHPETDMLQAFQNLQQKNEIAEVMKELFDQEKILLITDLTKDEIKLCTRIYTIAEMKGLNAWKKGLGLYIKLMLSKDRRSRREILDAIRGYNSQQGLLQKLNPFNRT
jgi:hypothetical protein